MLSGAGFALAIGLKAVGAILILLGIRLCCRKRRSGGDDGEEAKRSLLGMDGNPAAACGGIIDDEERKLPFGVTPPTARGPRAEPVLVLIERAIDAWLATNSHVAGMAVGVVHPGDSDSGSDAPVVEYVCRGKATLGGNDVSPETIFQIGSITKTFTAAMFADAVENGIPADPPPTPVTNLTFDTTPESVFDAVLGDGVVTVPTYNGKQMSLVNLGVHTSGLEKVPDNIKMGPYGYLVEYMYEYLNSDPALLFAPGSEYNYSNTGMATLANILALVTDTPDYEDLVQPFLARAGIAMPDTHVTTPDTWGQGPNKDRFATPYQANGTTPANVYLNSWPAFNGSGALYSTLPDMMEYVKWNLRMLDSPVADILPVIHVPRAPAQLQGNYAALGWRTRPLDVTKGQPESFLWANGATNGFQSYIAFVDGYESSTQTGLVILTNTKQNNDDLGQELINILHDYYKNM